MSYTTAKLRLAVEEALETDLTWPSDWTYGQNGYIRCSRCGRSKADFLTAERLVSPRTDTTLEIIIYPLCSDCLKVVKANFFVLEAGLDSHDPKSVASQAAHLQTMRRIMR